MWSVVFITVLIVVDQIVKIIAADWLRGSYPKVYLGGLVQFEYAENRGAFLSLGAALSDEARFWIFVMGVFLILGFCIYSLITSIHHRFSVFALSLVIAGGIGNLIDRTMRGSVIDFVHMGFGGLRTGVFNVADVAISAGVLLLLWQQMTTKEETKN